MDKTKSEKEYVRQDERIYNPRTGYIGHITDESEKEYIVKWFYNPNNGCGDYRTFLKSEVKNE